MIKVKPEERAIGRSVLVGAGVLAAIALVLALTAKVPTGLPFTRSTVVRAAFHDIHSLQVNAEVRRNSEYVGRVADIRTDGDLALVTMRLDGDQTLYADARAHIWDTSALATKFVELDFGTPERGPLGDAVLPAERNEDSADLNQLLDVFDPRTRAAAASSLRQVGGGMLGHGPDLHDYLATAHRTLPEFATVSETLASPDFNLPGLLASADTLTARFQQRTGEISDLVGQTDSTLRAIVTDGGGPLRSALDKAPATLAEVRPALDAVTGPLRDTSVAATTLVPGAHGVGVATPDLRGFLREAPDPLDRVPDFSDQAKPALADLTDTMHELGPLAPLADRGLTDLDPTISQLAAYRADITSWILRGRSFVSQGPEPAKRFARLTLAPGAEGLTTGRDSYPAPGEAPSDRFTPGTLIRSIK